MSAMLAEESTSPPQHLHVGDFGKDLDDEVASLVAAHLVKRGMLDLVGVVANLHPADQRAQLAKGTYISVGLDVPVAIGTSCGWLDREQDPYQFEADYLASSELVDVDGQKHFVTVAAALPDQSLDLLLMSGFTDAATWLRDEAELFNTKVRSVTMMSGTAVGPRSLSEIGIREAKRRRHRGGLARTVVE